MANSSIDFSSLTCGEAKALLNSPNATIGLSNATISSLTSLAACYHHGLCTPTPAISYCTCAPGFAQETNCATLYTDYWAPAYHIF